MPLRRKMASIVSHGFSFPLQQHNFGNLVTISLVEDIVTHIWWFKMKLSIKINHIRHHRQIKMILFQYLDSSFLALFSSSFDLYLSHSHTYSFEQSIIKSIRQEKWFSQSSKSDLIFNVRSIESCVFSKCSMHTTNLSHDSMNKKNKIIFHFATILLFYFHMVFFFSAFFFLSF